MATLVKPFALLITGVHGMWKSLVKHVDKDTARLVFVTLTVLLIFVTVLISLLLSLVVLRSFFAG